MGPKVTLLSVIIAIGVVQYNYFYSESRELQNRIERRDFGPLWADYVKQTEELRIALSKPDAHTRVTPEQFKQLQDGLTRMDEAILNAKNEWVAHFQNSLADFSIRFGFIYSIALLILSSISLDFVSQVWHASWLNPPFYSVIAFSTAIALSLLYLVFIIILVQTQIRNNATVD
jgi:hypothetical protein